MAPRTYGEEHVRIGIGKGLYTSELSSNIPDGFSPKVHNFIASGDSLENREGFRPSSVDYKYNRSGIPGQQEGIIIPLSSIGAGWPQLGWGEDHFLCFIRGPGTGSGDGFMKVNPAISGTPIITGMCQYNDVTYFAANGVGVYKITAYNWSTDAITYSHLTTTTSGVLYNLVSFKDRIWGGGGAAGSNKLYFTNLPAVGGYPDTWAFATNQIPISGPRGMSGIKQILPFQNKLMIFTGSGIFTLTVQGQPSSWILRTLDAEAICTSPQCAFESRGVVYYTTQNGVWATNGSDVVKLSYTIEDQFAMPGTNPVTSLHYMEDGMIVNISVNGASQLDATKSKIFYTKLDPVGWSQWGVDNGIDQTNLYGAHKIARIFSTSPKLSTFLGVDPTTYAILAVGSTNGVAADPITYQLAIYDGGEDKLWRPTGTSTQEQITEKIKVTVQTKYVDAGNAYALKTGKEAFVEIYTSDTNHKFDTKWSIDATTGFADAVEARTINEPTVGETSNLIRIPSSFPFRRAALTLSSEVQSNTSQIKIKEVAMLHDTERTVIEEVG